MSPPLPRAAGQHLEVPTRLTLCVDYSVGERKLFEIYEKAKAQQWDASRDIEWQDAADATNPLGMPDGTIAIFGSDLWKGMSERERGELRRQVQCWNLSQILHGEQAALLCAAKLMQSESDIGAKLCAAAQAIDEARHVEVYSRLLASHFDAPYPVSASLRSLLEDVLVDARPDITNLGMQILVEGIALAFFHNIRGYTSSPFIRTLFGYVLRDEARHFAAGRTSLTSLYAGFSDAERREREEFVCDASILLHDHLCADDIWEPIGFSRRQCVDIVRQSVVARSLRRSLFRRLVPSIREMGLLGSRAVAVFKELNVLDYAEFPV
jgi:hypothetical protein